MLNKDNHLPGSVHPLTCASLIAVPPVSRLSSSVLLFRLSLCAVTTYTHDESSILMATIGNVNVKEIICCFISGCQPAPTVPTPLAPPSLPAACFFMFSRCHSGQGALFVHSLAVAITTWHGGSYSTFHGSSRKAKVSSITDTPALTAYFPPDPEGAEYL